MVIQLICIDDSIGTCFHGVFTHLHLARTYRPIILNIIFKEQNMWRDIVKP